MVRLDRIFPGFRIRDFVSGLRTADFVSGDLWFDSSLVEVKADQVFVFFRIGFVRFPVSGINRNVPVRFRFFVRFVRICVGVVGIFSVDEVERKFREF